LVLGQIALADGDKDSEIAAAQRLIEELGLSGGQKARNSGGGGRAFAWRALSSPLPKQPCRAAWVAELGVQAESCVVLQALTTLAT
jgi:hypothetical protein